jgi:D-amino peptidase
MRSTVIVVLVVLTTVVPRAQTGKKVYISVDMEGISGISGDDQLSPTGREYDRSRKLMAEDVNAAIRGALAGGAAFVVVNDAHGGQRNLRPEDLHPSALLISHSFKRYGMMEGLDDTFDAAIFVGYHAKAQSSGGLFPHTLTAAVRDLRVKGKSVGEGGINTMLAEWYGVPVVVVTGDEVAVAQVAEVATRARSVIVKRAINTRAVELKPLEQAHREIEVAVRESVASAKRTSPQRLPLDVEIQFATTLIPEIAEAFSCVKRLAPDTIAFSSQTTPEAYRLARALYRYINPD